VSSQSLGESWGIHYDWHGSETTQGDMGSQIGGSDDEEAAAWVAPPPPALEGIIKGFVQVDAGPELLLHGIPGG
jgi:hypothetical protein